MQDCKRESVNCGNCFRLHGLECDEYPMAAAVEATQHAMSVSGLQNGVHGTFMRRFFQACNVWNGRKFRFRIINMGLI